MSAQPDYEADPLVAAPIYPISRPAAPGGVPLFVSVFGLLIPAMMATVFVSLFSIVLLPIGWWRLRKWYGNDLKKLPVAVAYLTGAWLSSDPSVTRPDGSKGPTWGGSTVSPLPNGPVGGMPRFLPLPRD